jgi:hypothetical protein
MGPAKRGGLRRPYLAALVGYLSVAAALSGSFGDYGHLTAMLIGFAAYPLVARTSGRKQTPIFGNLLNRRLVSSCETAVPPPSPAYQPRPD